MRKALCFCLTILLYMGCMPQAHAQEKDDQKRVLILRQAKEFQKSTVAIEAYLIENILEAKITARMMHATKPRIYNAIIVGPRLGRLSSETRETLPASLEQEDPYLTERKDKGFVHFGKKEKEKELKGTLTRELVEFRIPKDRIVKGKKYSLWVQIMSMQKGEKYRTFKFELKDLAELILQ